MRHSAGHTAHALGAGEVLCERVQVLCELLNGPHQLRELSRMAVAQREGREHGSRNPAVVLPPGSATTFVVAEHARGESNAKHISCARENTHTGKFMVLLPI